VAYSNVSDCSPAGTRLSTGWVRLGPAVRFVRSGATTTGDGARGPKLSGALVEGGTLYLLERNLPGGGTRLGVSASVERPEPRWGASWKLVPTNAAEIYRWWDLWRLRQHLFDAGCAGGTAGIPVRYLLVLRPGTLSRVADCGEVAWSNGTEALVRVEPRDGSGPGRNPS